MPILHAAYKHIKAAKKKTLRNQAIKSNLKTETKKFIDMVVSNKLEEAKKKLPDLISLIDKASSKGIIHKNTAARKKSRLTKKLHEHK